MRILDKSDITITAIKESNPKWFKTFENTFDLAYLFLFLNEPMELGRYTFFERFKHKGRNLLHYMVKSNDSNKYVTEDLHNNSEFGIIDFINLCKNKMDGFDKDRYAYLTIDSRIVEKDKTQRASGYHIDGLQGDEVFEKKPSDMTFVWCDNLPTEYAYQYFNIENLDISLHNIFSFLDIQVIEDTIKTFMPYSLLFMNSYCVHRAATANKNTDRIFLRLSYTHIPITSTKMTVNPHILYNYPIHTTTGTIPKHLIEPKGNINEISK